MIFLSYDLHIENESITMDRLFSFIIPVRMSIKLFCVKKEICKMYLRINKNQILSKHVQIETDNCRIFELFSVDFIDIVR